MGLTAVKLHVCPLSPTMEEYIDNGTNAEPEENVFSDTVCACIKQIAVQCRRQLHDFCITESHSLHYPFTFAMTLICTYQELRQRSKQLPRMSRLADNVHGSEAHATAVFTSSHSRNLLQCRIKTSTPKRNLTETTWGCTCATQLAWSAVCAGSTWSLTAIAIHRLPAAIAIHRLPAGTAMPQPQNAAALTAVLTYAATATDG